MFAKNQIIILFLIILQKYINIIKLINFLNIILNRNVECGTLHCQGGRDRPDSMFSDVTYHATHTQTGNNGDKFQCKMTNGVIDPETNEDLAMVFDGSTCGSPNSKMVDLNLSSFP